MSSSGAAALRVVSVFTGAAGLDTGMHAAGATTVAMCESWEPARRVLENRFPNVPVDPDIRRFTPSMPYDVLTAGFPCTDLSHAGGKAGIFGAQSGLVEHVFRIARETAPTWIVLENVPNLLHLHKGLGIKTVVERLEGLGYRWAYRTLDSRFTGVPQRRNRVIVIASSTHDPTAVLLDEDAGAPEPVDEPPGLDHTAYGFYWTEGRHGLGLIRDAIPTLKGGSTIGLPSAPAVWAPGQPVGRKLLLPSLSAGERLQGFPAGWTDAAVDGVEHDARWKLVGNAVTTGVGQWIGERLAAAPVLGNNGSVRNSPEHPTDAPWPRAAWGGPGVGPRRAAVSGWPQHRPSVSLASLIQPTWTPLSYRATRGFLERVDESGRELPARFAADLEEHLEVMTPPLIARDAPLTGSPANRLLTAVRHRLDAAGVSYRLGVRPVPAERYRLHLIVPHLKYAVNIRTCFWNGCQEHVDPQLAANPRWLAKRGRVTRRDIEMTTALTDRGWRVEVVWGHETPAVAALHVQRVVAGLNAAAARSSLSGSNRAESARLIMVPELPGSTATRSRVN